MGLDMYAYVAAKAGAQAEFNEGSSWDNEKGAMVNPNAPQPREIAYWRKHPNLHGWMHRLWTSRGNDGEFNGDELELTWDDLEQLEQDIRSKNLPDTSGFFFGNDADDHYREHDLKFVREAKAEAFLGLRVFYNSSW
jgi:hypothetical protein